MEDDTMLKNAVFKPSVNTVKWVKATAVRTVKTMAQAAIGVIGSTAIVTEVNWVVVGGTVALSGIVCVLTCIAGIPEVSTEEE